MIGVINTKAFVLSQERMKSSVATLWGLWDVTRGKVAFKPFFKQSTFISVCKKTFHLEE